MNDISLAAYYRHLQFNSPTNIRQRLGGKYDRRERRDSSNTLHIDELSLIVASTDTINISATGCQ